LVNYTLTHLITSMVGEIKLSLVQVEPRSGSLGHQLRINGLPRLNADHKLVALAGAFGENVTGYLHINKRVQCMGKCAMPLLNKQI